MRGGVKMGTRKLQAKIVEVYGTRAAFAEAMGMSKAVLSQRLNGGAEWKIPEIVKACELLHIDLSDAWIYFFTEKV